MYALLLAALFMAGTSCKPKEERPSLPGVKVGTTSKLIEEMAPHEVILSVNGVALTREAYDDAMALKETLYVLGRPATTKQEVTMSRPYWARAVLQEFVSRQVILQAARAKQHQTTTEALRASRADVASLLKVEERDVERKFTEMGRVGLAMKNVMEENAVIRSFRETEHGQSLKVTPSDVDTRIREIKAYHERAEATNQLVMAKGRTIYEQLKKGEDFMKLAGIYSEAEETPKGTWGTFLKGELDDAKIRESAFSLPVGGVSEPIDTEEGLVLLKVLDRKVEVLGPAVEPSGPATVTLGRILLRMAQGGAGTKLPTREEVEKALMNQKVKELQQKWIPSLVATATIAYPNGTNLWLSAKAKKSARPQRGMRNHAKEDSK